MGRLYLFDHIKWMTMPSIRFCSPAARWLYLELACMVADCSGLQIPIRSDRIPEGLANVCGTNADEAARLAKELESNGLIVIGEDYIELPNWSDIFSGGDEE